jgi:MYXO-CTERM domain-containing protein
MILVLRLGICALVGLLTATVARANVNPPDAGGYYCTQSGQTFGPTFFWEEIAQTGTRALLASSCNDCIQQNVPIGFDFEFYGRTYTRLGISSNGFVTFDSSTLDAGCCSGQELPDPSPPNAVIALWWEDLNPPQGGNIYFQTLGSAPARRFIVEYAGVPHCCASLTPVQVQLKLFEGSNDIELHFLDAASDGGLHTAGIEDLDGLIGQNYAHGPASVTPGGAVLYSLCGDGDGDLLRTCDGDCYDDDPTLPTTTEVACNGIDDDCDPATPDGADGDGDGVAACAGDCDDTDPTVFPGHVELRCDGLDNDCDPSTGDDGDDDGDGYGLCGVDCDDTDPLVNPGATEILCDGLDNDCDLSGSPDDPDGDGDGFGLCSGDCDDADPGRNPGVADPCDGSDNNCDGLADTRRSIIDGGGAGTAIPPVGTVELHAPVGLGNTVLDVDLSLDLEHDWVGDLRIRLRSPRGTNVVVFERYGGNGDGLIGTLFDDESPRTISTAAPPFTGRWQPALPLATFDGEDPHGTWTLYIEDLASPDGGQVLGWQLHIIHGGAQDLDADGFSACEECADNAAWIQPGAQEICDGYDSDCDGSIGPSESDLDADGQATCAGDCDDGDPLVSTGAAELCDGVDNDCDGTLRPDETDLDGDGLLACAEDCDDTNPTIPGALELTCNGADDDCDPLSPDDPDQDGDGHTLCTGDCDDQQPAIHPSRPERPCNGFDDDCNPATVDASDLDGDGFTDCQGDCDDTDPDIRPGADEDPCVAVDQDCDGSTPDLSGCGEETPSPSPSVSPEPSPTGHDPDPGSCGCAAGSSSGDPPLLWAILAALAAGWRRSHGRGT